jgi:hypothetical protein
MISIICMDLKIEDYQFKSIKKGRAVADPAFMNHTINYYLFFFK